MGGWVRERLHWFLAGILVAGTLQADVFRVQAPRSHGMRNGDRVCLFKTIENLYSHDALGCGPVSGVGPEWIYLDFDGFKGTLEKGDAVIMHREGGGRAPTSYKSFLVSQTPAPRGALSFGGQISSKFAFPVLHLQVSVSRKFALGLMPSYSTIAKDGGTVRILGTLFTVEGFLGYPWNGPSLQLGAGAYSFKIESPTQTEAIFPFTAQGTVNWRLLLPPFVFAAGVGGSYVSPVTSRLINYEASGILPLARIEIGVVF